MAKILDMQRTHHFFCTEFDIKIVPPYEMASLLIALIKSSIVPYKFKLNKTSNDPFLKLPAWCQ